MLLATSSAEPYTRSARTLRTLCHLHGDKQKKKTFLLPQPKPLAQVHGNGPEPVHAHDITLLTKPRAAARTITSSSLAGAMSALTAHVQEKQQRSLGLHPDAPIALPDPELVFDGLAKQKRPKPSKQ